MKIGDRDVDPDIVADFLTEIDATAKDLAQLAREELTELGQMSAFGHPAFVQPVLTDFDADGDLDLVIPVRGGIYRCLIALTRMATRVWRQWRWRLRRWWRRRRQPHAARRCAARRKRRPRAARRCAARRKSVHRKVFFLDN